MTRELVVLPGDDVGREVIPLAVQCLLAVLPGVRRYDGEGGWDEAWRTGRPLSAAILERVRASGSVLLGPQRPFPDGETTVLDYLTEALDLYAVLLPLRAASPSLALLLMAEHPPPGVEGDTRSGRLTPVQAWSATRLGNLAGALLPEQGRVALAHDSEEEFARAVAAGIGEHVELERLDALFLINQFGELAGEFDLILSSAHTGNLIVPHAVRQLGSLAETGQLFVGARGHVASPVHGPLRDQAGWGFANPIGAVRAVVALLRYAWEEERAANRLETALERALQRRRTPDQGGLHTMYEVVRAILHELEASGRAGP